MSRPVRNARMGDAPRSVKMLNDKGSSGKGPDKHDGRANLRGAPSDPPKPEKGSVVRKWPA